MVIFNQFSYRAGTQRKCIDAVGKNSCTLKLARIFKIANLRYSFEAREFGRSMFVWRQAKLTRLDAYIESMTGRQQTDKNDQIHFQPAHAGVITVKPLNFD